MNELLKSSDDDTEFAKELKVAISSDLKPRHSEAQVSLLLDKCSFLGASKCLDDLEGTKNKIADEGVTVLMDTTMDSSPSTSTSSGSTQSTLSHTEEFRPPKKKRKGLGTILTKKI